MKKLYSIVGMWIVSAFCLLSAQSRVYSSVENVHSHNDYLQNVPFYTAYSARCASIEADVFLVDGELYVGQVGGVPAVDGGGNAEFRPALPFTRLPAFQADII